MKGFILGASLGSIVRVMWKILKTAAKIIAEAVFYCGLYIPLLYLIFGAVLYGIFKFDPFDLSTDSTLYIFGLCLCGVCSVIIAIKNLFIRPYEKYVKKAEIIEYKGAKTSKKAPEAPKIYKSRVNPGIIVYEYANRYDLYEADGDGLQLVETEYKTRKEKRW